MVTIRPAKQEDLQSIWRVHTRAIKEVCKNHYSAREIKAWAAVLKPARYRGSIEKGVFFVAVEDEDIVGFGNLNRDTCEVEAMYVDPDHLRRGVGMKILRNIETVARDCGLTTLRLTSSLNAVPFYQKAGFEPQKHTKYLLPFDKVPCVPMVKEL